MTSLQSSHTQSAMFAGASRNQGKQPSLNAMKEETCRLRKKCNSRKDAGKESYHQSLAHRQLLEPIADTHELPRQ